jgi:cardiolipin synthase (CMP-forming)
VRDFDWGARADRPPVERDQVLTVPNAISGLRLLGLPVFVYLMVGPEAYGQAFAVLAVVACTDWVDGYVARRFDQVTKLGRVLDPLIDRALMVTVALTLLLVGIMPWWLVVLVVGRDAALVAGALAMYRGVPPIPVTRTGKFATACLLVALPGFLLGAMDWGLAEPFAVAAWGFAVVGLAAYYVAGVQYAQAAWALRESRP